MPLSLGFFLLLARALGGLVGDPRAVAPVVPPGVVDQLGVVDARHAARSIGRQDVAQRDVELEAPCRSVVDRREFVVLMLKTVRVQQVGDFFTAAEQKQFQT